MFKKAVVIARDTHFFGTIPVLVFLVTAACMVWAGSSWAGARNPADGPSPNLVPPPAAKDSRSEAMAGSEVFLQGNFVEVGVSGWGTFGTDAAAPRGFHTFGRSNLGVVADFQRDGWEAGDPSQTGDYILPGSPFEGWAIKWGNTENPNYANFGGSSWSTTSTGIMNNRETGMESAVWVGEIAGSLRGEHLRLIQTVSAGAGDLFFVVNVQVTNTGTVALPTVRYLRCVDPDMEADWGGDYATSNYVAYQPRHPENSNKALVVAQGLMNGMTLGLGAYDWRATASVSLGWAMDPDGVYDNLFEPPQSDPSIGDSAIAMAFALGDLAPGQSVSFDFAYILNEPDLDPALDSLGAVTLLQPSGSVSGKIVPFQVTTNDLAHTRKVDFFVNGNLVGTDFKPDWGGAFCVTFNAMDYPNKTNYKFLRAVATFWDGHTVSKTTTVAVLNSEPPVGF
jgi:hypothetical protein